jgi:hypothetical protein
MVLGLACGWFFGFTKKAFLVPLPIWLVVLVFQRTVTIPDSNLPPEDWAYIPVQAAIVGTATFMVWLGSKIHTRFAT